MKLLGLAALAIVCIGAAAIAWVVAYPSVTMRYRLTLEAEVDGQPKSGSGTVEVTYKGQPEIGSGRDFVWGYRGEAVALDLGERGTLFALLKAGDDSRSAPETIIFRACGFPGGIWPRGSMSDVVKQIQRISGKCELPLDSLPMLVRFADMNDPKTVERVSPNNLAAQFGPGARLVRASLQVVPSGSWKPSLSQFRTETAATITIEQRLPWLPRYHDRMFDEHRYETISSELRLANSLSAGAFKAGQ